MFPSLWHRVCSISQFWHEQAFSRSPIMPISPSNPCHKSAGFLTLTTIFIPISLWRNTAALQKDTNLVYKLVLRVNRWKAESTFSYCSEVNSFSTVFVLATGSDYTVRFHFTPLRGQLALANPNARTYRRGYQISCR